MGHFAPLIAGNWKMFGRRKDLAEVRAVAGASVYWEKTRLRVAICPPATLLVGAVEAGGAAVAIGGQDCAAGLDGAHTGDLSAAMLADVGARFVILGHSERRRDHGETSALVAAKARAALAAGLSPIICVGETLEERQAGQAAAVVKAQIGESVPEWAGAHLVVAYEPVWAIGTGLTPTGPEIEDIHGEARQALKARLGTEGGDAPVLYGGSVKPGNAAEILRLKGVDGALVGGASLKAAEFLAIIQAHPLIAAR
jgi:triosephosphate isomerase